MMCKVLRLALAAATLFVVSGLWVVTAQDSERAMVLGAWVGTVTYAASAPASMEFSDDGGIIKWKFGFKASPDLYGDAEGTVTSFSSSALEAVGVYTNHSVPGARGTAIRFALKLDGDRMTGTATAAMNNLPITVSLTKKK